MTLSATTLPSSPNTHNDCVWLFSSQCEKTKRGRGKGRRQYFSAVGQQEQYSNTQIRLALASWWSSAGPLLWSQVSFTRMESGTFALTQLGSNSVCNVAFWSIFCLSGMPHYCTVPFEWTCLWGNERKLYSTSLFMLSHQHDIPFPQRQRNLQWEMSSCTKHDLRFHLLLKCLGCRRILAELAGLHFLWTHRDVGGYVSVITSRAKSDAVYSLEYLFFFFFEK